jgi:hypothetical protein
MNTTQAEEQQLHKFYTEKKFLRIPDDGKTPKP